MGIAQTLLVITGTDATAGQSLMKLDIVSITIVSHFLITSKFILAHAYDSNGKTNPWFTKNDERIYQEKMNCLIEQYNNYTV